MLTTEKVRTRYISESTAQHIADQWNAVYPAMRRILDTVITAQRGAQQAPTVPAQAVDLDRWDRADSEQAERGATR